jgi:hypothetical protein
VRPKKPILEIATEDGFINITADEISAVPDEYLKRWRISRAQLHHCFNRGQELMERYKPADRVRPCAEETWDGKWEVRIVAYSQYSDPAMGDDPAGNA